MTPTQTRPMPAWPSASRRRAAHLDRRCGGSGGRARGGRSSSRPPVGPAAARAGQALGRHRRSGARDESGDFAGRKACRLQPHDARGEPAGRPATRGRRAGDRGPLARDSTPAIPAWSPDGARLLYTSIRAGSRSSPRSVAPRGFLRRRAPTFAWVGVWAPRGMRSSTAAPTRSTFATWTRMLRGSSSRPARPTRRSGRRTGSGSPTSRAMSNTRQRRTSPRARSGSCGRPGGAPDSNHRRPAAPREPGVAAGQPRAALRLGPGRWPGHLLRAARPIGSAGRGAGPAHHRVASAHDHPLGGRPDAGLRFVYRDLERLDGPAPARALGVAPGRAAGHHRLAGRSRDSRSPRRPLAGVRLQPERQSGHLADAARRQRAARAALRGAGGRVSAGLSHRTDGS